jgi:lysine/arginine/ornithine transport system substrate-binding protein
MEEKLRKLLFFVMSFVLATASYGNTLTVIRFGVDPSYPPFESKGADGKFHGFDIDLGEQICARLNAKCVWVENDFDGMIPALKARKFDAILSAMSNTPQRAAQIAFSDKTYNMTASLIARKGSNLALTPEGLSGKSIGVEQGSSALTYAKMYWEPAGARIVSYQNQDQVYEDLISGRLDAAFQATAQAETGFLKTPRGAGFEFVGKPLNDPKIFGEGAAIGMRKTDTELISQINRALASIIKDGTYKSMASKYFDFDIYGN